MASAGEMGEGKCWLMSSGATIVSMTVAGLLIPMFFRTNDDPYVIQALSGGGGVAAEPTQFISFVNVVLCQVFAGLYVTIPSVPWWTLFHLAAIFVSSSALGCVILDGLFRTGLRGRHLICWALLCCIDFGLSAYFVGRLQFTSTASLLMAAAVLSACSRWQDGARSRGGWVAIVASAVMGTVGFALRLQSGYLGFFFWGLAILALMTRGSGNLRSRLTDARYVLVPLLCSLVAATALLVADSVAYSSTSLSASLEMDSALARFTGYPRTSYAQDPSRYEGVGWDEELFELAGQWFLMDERVNVETLSKLNEQNTAAIDELVEHPWSTILSRLNSVSQPVPMTYFALLLGAAIVALALSPSRGERAVVWLICGAVVALLGYLLLRGRLLERAAYAVTIPATAALLTVVLRNVMVPRQEGRSTPAPAVACVLGLALLAPLGHRAEIIARMAYALGAAFCIAVATWAMLARREFASVGRARLVAAVLAAALVLAPGVVTVKKLGVGSWEARRQEELLANTQAFFDYVRERSDTLYVYAGCPITMQYVWQGDWPVNQTGWGGWRWPYEWFDEAMRAAGFDGRPTSEDFLDGDALFVSGSESTCDLLLRYMRSTHGDDVQMIQVDEIAGSMRVYQFLRGED